MIRGMGNITPYGFGMGKEVLNREASVVDSRVRAAAYWTVAGLTQPEIAKQIGVTKYTVEQYKRNYPDVWYDAIKEAGDQMLPEPRRKAVEALQEIIDNRSGHETTNVINAAKAILGHYERMQAQILKVEHTGRDGGPIQTAGISLDVIIGDPESFKLAKQLARRTAGVSRSGDDGDEAE